MCAPPGTSSCRRSWADGGAGEPAAGAPVRARGLHHRHGTSSGSTQVQQDLRREEPLGILVPRLDAPDTHQPEEELVVPPVTVDLAGIALVEQLHLAPGLLGGEADEVRGCAEVAVPLRDLVVQHQRVAPDGGGQAPHQPVVLVRVVDARGEDEVGLHPGRDVLERLLGLVPVRRQATVGEAEGLELGTGHEPVDGGTGLVGTPLRAGQHHARQPQALATGQAQQGATTADLDVVRVRAQTEDVQRTPWQAHPDHAVPSLPGQASTLTEEARGRDRSAGHQEMVSTALRTGPSGVAGHQQTLGLHPSRGP